MPSITRNYPRTIFKAEVIQDAIALTVKMGTRGIVLNFNDGRSSNSLSIGNDWWRFDSLEEFFHQYRQAFEVAIVEREMEAFRLEVRARRDGDFEVYTEVTVRADTKPHVFQILELFDRHAKESYVEQSKTESPCVTPCIFIGHGGKSTQWRDLKDHLSEQHKYQVEAYETGARAGHTIRDILDEMMSKSSFAILVMTPEDLTVAGSYHPRLNVVHELGLFQGRLGFARAIVLLEDGTEDFSNIDGIQQIRFKKNNIRETFGDILATLKREFSQ